jgi:hypothetical protein
MLAQAGVRLDGEALDESALDLPASVSRIDQQSMQTKAQTTVVDAANGTIGLVGHARARPKAMAYGTPGICTPQHITGEMLQKVTLAGWRVVERDVSYHPRAEGTRSKVSGSVRGTARTARDFWRVLA